MRTIFHSAVALLTFAVLPSCALRPLYKDVIVLNKPQPAPTRMVEQGAPIAAKPFEVVALQLLDRHSKKPISNALVEVGEYGNKWSATTRVDGTFTLPLDIRYQNTFLVVSVPTSIEEYDIVAAPALPVPPPPPVLAPRASPPAQATPPSPAADSPSGQQL